MEHEALFTKLVTKTYDYLVENSIKNMVIGVSGGIDSTLVSAICHEVVTRYPYANFKLIGLSMPCDTNEECENLSADLVMKAFCDKRIYINIQKEFEVVKDSCEQYHNSTKVSLGNIKARLRMIHLYNTASVEGGIVMDNDNLTENNTGFFTIHGDVCDLNPIGCLWKSEVYELSEWVANSYYLDKKYEKQREAILCSMSLTPTDGNGVAEGGDMAQIAPGHTYSDVDQILSVYIGQIKEDDMHKCLADWSESAKRSYEFLLKKYGKKTCEMVIDRHKRTEFKRKKMPIVPVSRAEINMLL